MVHLGDFAELRKGGGTTTTTTGSSGKRRKKEPVKLEISALDWDSPPQPQPTLLLPKDATNNSKRLKPSSSPQPPLVLELQPWVVNPAAPASPSDLALADEPCPLGLRLRKSPSLVDLIQMRLAEENTKAAQSGVGAAADGKKRDSKHHSAPSAAAAVVSSSSPSPPGDKLKASNFPIHLLRIGTWECVSRYEGDLVAKCYFAKRKLVWEILDGGLKNKIEIQWSDITAFRAAYSDNDLGTLDIVLARQPVFYRETNPQPRKHTLWQGTSDFTAGQATRHRRHFLQCQGGQLSKHIEKIMQCDPRLNSISQLPDVHLDSPYFEPATCSVSDAKGEIDFHAMESARPASCPTSSGFNDATTTTTSNSGHLSPESSDVHSVMTEDFASRGFPSMTSGTMRQPSGPQNQQDDALAHRLKVHGLRSTMSITDLVNYLESHISDQRSLRNLPYCSNSLSDQVSLEQIKDALLGDSQNQKDPASNDIMLMNRVSSLLSLIEKDAAGAHDQQNYQDVHNDDNLRGVRACSPLWNQSSEMLAAEDGEISLHEESMTKEESFVDLLHQLPRIASLPQFLTMSEEA